MLDKYYVLLYTYALECYVGGDLQGHLIIISNRITQYTEKEILKRSNSRI